ncbi:MAG: hypothetical protein GY917_16345, partial [Planctomycetaceae bacterium]|nr:hypothetical protein [Planctomycetaceae bacterium]
NHAPVARNDAYQVDRGNVLKSDNVATVEQDFSSDPGWTSHGNNQGGNEFGYQDGKIGGRFTRSSSARHYGDTNLASPISFDLPFSASGSFRAEDINHPDFGNGMMFGHFTVGGPDEGVQNGPFKVGIGLTDNSQGNVLWWYGGILDNSGLAMDAVGHVVLELKSDHEWSYNWNPEGGQGHGSLTVTLDGKASTLELSQQQRQMLTGSMNAFGLAGNPASHPNSGMFADISIDNVSYTSSQGQGVLANDSDPDGDAIESHLVRDVQHGTLALAKDGTFTYTPD